MFYNQLPMKHYCNPNTCSVIKNDRDPIEEQAGF